jgi:redox-sensitive bicupin YhaK (pirin superfamily)
MTVAGDDPPLALNRRLRGAHHAVMLEHVIEQRRRDLGGFEVGRILPASVRRMVGPFIFFDHMGPTQFAPAIPRSADVRPHPHIGLATVTYLYAGEIMHRDSVGSEQSIQPGAVNWMTAGRGITHSERFEGMRDQGGLLDGIQSWVALPEHEEECEPAFVHHPADCLPVICGEGLWARLIAGTAFGVSSPVQTRSPLFYAHCLLQKGAVLQLPQGYAERAAYIASGAVNADGQRHGSGQMLVFRSGAGAQLTALEPSTVMILGGEPVGERFIEWNFVSSSRERIEQAKSDWRAGRLRLPHHDDREYIPLPGG